MPVRQSTSLHNTYKAQFSVQLDGRWTGCMSCSVNGKARKKKRIARHAQTVLPNQLICKTSHVNAAIKHNNIVKILRSDNREPQQTAEKVLVWFYFSISGCSSGTSWVGLWGGGEAPSVWSRELDRSVGLPDMPGPRLVLRSLIGLS